MRTVPSRRFTWAQPAEGRPGPSGNDDDDDGQLGWQRFKGRSMSHVIHPLVLPRTSDKLVDSNKRTDANADDGDDNNEDNDNDEDDGQLVQ